jgi:RNA polymerase-associated protein CTR9
MQHPDERLDTLRSAMKSFDDALRASGGRNLMAMMGKARVFYSTGKYGEAYNTFQQVLQRAANTVDPDPRIGIGCCLWQLGHLEDAKDAWTRALDVVCLFEVANQPDGI